MDVLAKQIRTDPGTAPLPSEVDAFLLTQSVFVAVRAMRPTGWPVWIYVNRLIQSNERSLILAGLLSARTLIHLLSYFVQSAEGQSAGKHAFLDALARARRLSRTEEDCTVLRPEEASRMWRAAPFWQWSTPTPPGKLRAL